LKEDTAKLGAAPAAAHAPRRFEREIGSYGGEEPGPLFVVVGGLHGNEPAGIYAAERVLRELHARRPRMRGRVVALAGNLRALERDQRYLESDLNRIWRAEVVARVASQPPTADSPEEGELRELVDALNRWLGEPHERVVFLDLHTTSAGGAPFLCMGDTLQNRHVALGVPIPLILGLEEVIHGSLLEFVGERGHAAVAIEGGQHIDPLTIDHHEAGLWLVLLAGGALAPGDVPDLAAKRELLERASRGVPPVVEVVHRQETTDDDEFVMEPGYRNFQPVRRGELLARDRRGEIRAHRRGRVLLPRYQGQGNDAFFLSRRVRPFWLRVSAWLRRRRAERLLPLLPGIRRSERHPNVLIADHRVARWWLVEIFHLFGYRRRTRVGEQVVFERRREGKPWPRG